MLTFTKHLLSPFFVDVSKSLQDKCCDTPTFTYFKRNQGYCEFRADIDENPNYRVKVIKNGTYQMKPYYDHDFLWAQRVAAGNPVWGAYSHRVYAEVLELIEAFSGSEKSVLDVGCGAGAFGVLAQAKGMKYFGVDASSVAIDLGKKFHSQLNLQALDFVACDSSVLQGERFTILTCINVLHCLTGARERNSLLKNLQQAATPAGILILTTMMGPVDEDAQEKRLPRAYKLAEEIVEELRLNGWGRVLARREAGPNVHSKIGNLTVVCQQT